MIGSTDILNAKVLIVDDQLANVQLLEQMLHGAGYACVTSTTNPGDACGLHLKNRYDLILLDLQMPGMDGLEVMHQLRNNDTWKDIPIIALTALAMPGDRERCLAAGANELSRQVRCATPRQGWDFGIDVRLSGRGGAGADVGRADPGSGG